MSAGRMGITSGAHRGHELRHLGDHQVQRRRGLALRGQNGKVQRRAGHPDGRSGQFLLHHRAPQCHPKNAAHLQPPADRVRADLVCELIQSGSLMAKAISITGMDNLVADLDCYDIFLDCPGSTTARKPTAVRRHPTGPSGYGSSIRLATSITWAGNRSMRMVSASPTMSARFTPRRSLWL